MTIYKKDFYVYAYLREDSTPYYIGKGTGRRAFLKSTRAIPKPSDPSRIRIFMKNLSEPDAFSWEKYWIKIFGRKDNCTGILRNLTDGGEGNYGKIMSLEAKKKLSELAKGRKPSLETRQKMSDAQKGEKNHMYGKPGTRTGKQLSKETKQRMSDERKGIPKTEEAKKKMSESRKIYLSKRAGLISTPKEKSTAL